MSILVKASPYNPIPFYEKDMIVGNTGYPHPRRAFPEDSLEPGEYNAPYRQPITRDQVICLQFDRGNEGTDAWNYAIFRFIDEDGIYIDFKDPTEFYTLPGKVDENGEQLYTIQITFKPSDYSFLDDKDYISIELEVHFGDGSAINVGDTRKTLTTTLLHLADEHPDTTLIKYSNDTNTYDGTLFEAPMAFRGQIRVEAGRLRPIHSGEYTVFEDQNSQLSKLYGQQYNKYEWDAINLPQRILDILNYAVKCDNVRVGESNMVLEENGAPDSEAGKPRETRTYVFRDRDINKTLEFSEVLIPLWTRPSTGYNYAITRTALFGDGSFINMLPRVFESSVDENAWISLAETQKTSEGLTGSFIETDGTFYYKNGPGEGMRLVLAPEVKPKELLVTFNIANAPRIPNIALYYPDSTIRNIVFKDTTGGGEALVFSNDGLSTSVSKTYGSNGTVTFRIFHNDEEIEYGLNVPGGYPKVTNVTGLCSTKLNKLHIQNCNLSAHTTFDLSFLAPAKFTLRTLIIKSSQLKGFTAGWASGLVSGSFKPFAFTYVDLGSNTINTTNVDAIVNEFYNSCGWGAGAYSFLIVGQTPAAPPSASTAAITDMVTNYFWYFLTD